MNCPTIPRGYNSTPFTAIWRAATGRPVSTRLLCKERLPGRTASAFITRVRSEEHTSELQSLMRISYAVFCLKKKKKKKRDNEDVPSNHTQDKHTNHKQSSK